MSKAAQERRSGKKQLPSRIPPFKTPRQLKMKKTGNESVRQEVVDGSETDRQGVVDATETEQKESCEDTYPLPLPKTGPKDKEDSGSDEDNIPFIQIQGLKAKKKNRNPTVGNRRGECWKLNLNFF
jgi:hypothetical protein